MAYGADYNPEQWPESVWPEDMRLMREAGVNIVSVGIFSWALLQPTRDTWDFGWLDRALDLLHANGIAVDLATATASPPPWLTTLHPEVLPVTRSGETVWPGGRQQWRPTSPIFREYALALVTAMADRYRDHPALAMWHVSNELGCHNAFDYSDDAAAAFRAWLQTRYGTTAELNRAWGTAFWSQHYSVWSEILPPRLAATHPNPTQQLDFARFSSDALKGYLVAERDILHQATPTVPVTTNFMVMGESKAMNYADWAPEVDIVSNDHYLLGADPLSYAELSFSANLTGHLADAPWFLMEHSTSAVNWQPVNLAKTPGQLRRDSLTHVAHGADAVCFFQWRQSLAGAEKFHSAMLPHAGSDTAVFRDVASLGADLAGLSELVGTRTARARIAILFDWESWWAAELDSHPSAELRYKRDALAWYAAALATGLEIDVVPVAGVVPGAAGASATSVPSSIAAYDIVIAPMLYLVPPALAAALADYATGGGHLVVGYFSGIADRDDHVYPGGYPGAFRDLLGVRTEEFGPMLPGESATLDTGATVTLWTENLRVTDDTDVLARYVDGPNPGVAAITSRTTGSGRASYIATDLDAAGRADLLARFATDAGIYPLLADGGDRIHAGDRTHPGDHIHSGDHTNAGDRVAVGASASDGIGRSNFRVPSGDRVRRNPFADRDEVASSVEVARRVSASEEFVFLINHGSGWVRVHGVDGVDLLTGVATDGDVYLDVNGVAVVKRPREDL
jgi:beta-galactosidase